MTRTIAAMLAAATIAGMAAPAAAQTRYYARERLGAMPIASNPPIADEDAYTGAWTSQSKTPTYSKCAAGNQQVSYVPTCMKDGRLDQTQASCDPATKAASTRSTTRSCTLDCETPTASTRDYYDRDSQLARFDAGTTLDDAIVSAKALCEQVVIGGTRNLAYCQVYYNANGFYYAYIISVATQKTTATAANKVWVGQCTRP